MAYQLTQRAKDLSTNPVKSPNLVMEIDGSPYIFGTRTTSKLVRYGQDSLVYGQANIVYGGTVEISNSRDWIALDGTSSTVRNQLEPDKGSVTTTQNMTVKVLDIDGFMSELIAPGFIVDDLLYKTARLSVGFVEGEYPSDYIQVLQGKIQSIRPLAGAVEFVISNPEDIKRAKIFSAAQVNLTENCYYKSADIQDLTYVQKLDEPEEIRVEYFNGGLVGQSPSVSVSSFVGYKKISVGIQASVTTANSIKRAVNNNDDANQLCTVINKDGGTPTNAQVLQAETTLGTSNYVAVDSVDLFLSQVDPVFRTYVRIGDEIIRYTGIDTVNSRLTGITRGELNSTANNHKVGAEASSFYKLGDGTDSNGRAIDLALYTYLSGGDEYYQEEVLADQINQIGPFDFVQNGLFFTGQDLVRLFGVVTGDKMRTTGSLNPGNNFVDRNILSIEVSDAGTLLVVDGANLTTETNTTIVCDFKSQYAVLPDGLGLKPREVEIEEFRQVEETFFSSIPTFELYIKDTLDGKTWVDEEIFLPSGLYGLPRKGKLSVKMHSPPLFSANIPTLGLDTVKDPSQLKLQRSVSENFYNSIVYRINEDSVEDKKLNGYVTLSTTSTNRIKAPNRPYTIQAGGLRPSVDTEGVIRRVSRRFLSRYQLGAESVSVEVPFGVGFPIEVGDSVIFGDDTLQISDSKTGAQTFSPRLFEVVNREFNWVTGKISLKIVDTNYSQDKRYGVFSPSSRIIAGSTTTEIKITNSFGVDPTVGERAKWSRFVGMKLRVHSTNYATDFTTTLLGFSDSDPSLLLVDTMPSVPTSGMIVDVADYGDASDLYKQLFCFVSDSTEITFVNATDNIEVADSSRAIIGKNVRVHNQDFSRDNGAEGTMVESIVGPDLLLDTPLDFIPVVGDTVDVLGFDQDEGLPYSFL